MEARRVPTGGKVLLGVGIYVLTFLLAKPSDPVTKEEYAFWNTAASLFGRNDVDSFVGIALLMGCSIVTIVVWQIMLRLIERQLNKRDKLNK